MTEQIKTIKRYESSHFTLGTCACGCGTEIDIFSPKSKGRKTGYLRKYADRSHALTSRNQMGENNHMWKGGRIVDKDGYIKVIAPAGHPFKDVNNRIYEHRLVYENYLSIILDEQVYLNPEEEIHHINKIKDDNSLINLQYMKNSKEHSKEHLKSYDGVICRTCGSSKTSIRKDDGQPKWLGNETDGYQCESCNKKEYYIKNKERIQKYRLENRDRMLKQQKEYNDTKRKGRGASK